MPFLYETDILAPVKAFFVPYAIYMSVTTIYSKISRI